MNSPLSYSPIAVGGIAKALAVLFESDSEDHVITRASATNVIVSGVTLEELASATLAVESIAPVHPARFFIPVMDPNAEEMRAEVAAACVKVSNGNDVCSEIVRLYFPDSARLAVPSVIRANMLPGLSSEVFAFGWDDSSQQLIKQSDLLFIDSHELPIEALLKLIEIVIQGRVPTVDFNWVRLGVWREEIKRVFDLPSAQRALNNLRKITIESAPYVDGEYEASAFTLAGWLCHRLGAEPLSLGHSGWECRRRTGGEFFISIKKVPQIGPAATIQRVILDGSAGGDGSSAIATLSRNAVLETQIHAEGGLVLQRAVEDDDGLAVIERFFLVGDSTVNYEPSLKIAVELSRLSCGFNG